MSRQSTNQQELSSVLSVKRGGGGGDNFDLVAAVVVVAALLSHTHHQTTMRPLCISITSTHFFADVLLEFGFCIIESYIHDTK